MKIKGRMFYGSLSVGAYDVKVLSMNSIQIMMRR